MAHTFDTKLQINGSTNPLNANYTCGAGATLLVIGIVCYGTVARAGGAPTYNGVALTEVYSGIRDATALDTVVDMYYLLVPPTGSSLQISIPNTGTKLLYCVVSSYKAQSGYTSAFDVKNSNTGVTITPTNTVVTTVDGDVIVQVAGCDYNNIPIAHSHTLLYSTDDGPFSDNHQYALQATLGSITLTWTTQQADAWQAIVGAWKEVVSTITLVIAEMLHSQAIDNLVLIQNLTLTIQEMLHTQTIDNVVITIEGILLVIDEMLHSQSMGGLTLSQVHNLIVQELFHSQGIEGLTLIQNLTLAINDLFHSQTLDSLNLIQQCILAISDILHSQNIEELSLLQIHNLIIDELLHSQNIDVMTLIEKIFAWARQNDGTDVFVKQADGSQVWTKQGKGSDIWTKQSDGTDIFVKQGKGVDIWKH